jgi:YgiT-type zinc finger domain-containing protein
MSNKHPKDTMVEKKVAYTIESDGRLVVIENAPARVCVETGEQFFSPDTVEHIRAIIGGKGRPAPTAQTPVYEFAA